MNPTTVKTMYEWGYSDAWADVDAGRLLFPRWSEPEYLRGYHSGILDAEAHYFNPLHEE